MARKYDRGESAATILALMPASASRVDKCGGQSDGIEAGMDAKADARPFAGRIAAGSRSAPPPRGSIANWPSFSAESVVAEKRSAPDEVADRALEKPRKIAFPFQRG